MDLYSLLVQMLYKDILQTMLVLMALFGHKIPKLDYSLNLFVICMLQIQGFDNIHLGEDALKRNML